MATNRKYPFEPDSRHWKKYCHIYDAIKKKPKGTPADWVKNKHGKDYDEREVRRFLEELEEYFKDMEGEDSYLIKFCKKWDISDKGVAVYKEWSRLLSFARSSEQNLFHTKQADKVGVAASMTVASHLLPQLENMFHQKQIELSQHETKAKIQLQPIVFNPEAVQAGIIDFDLAIIWDGYNFPGHLKWKNYPLKNSQADLCVLIHSSHQLLDASSLLAKEYLEHLSRYSSAAKPHDFCVDISCLEDFKIVYPDMPSLNDFIQKHKQRLLNVQQVPGIYSTVNYIQTAPHNTLGLIPGWRWVRSDFLRLFSLLSFPLEENNAPVPPLKLAAFLPPGGKRKLSPSAKLLLQTLQELLNNLNTPNPWHFAKNVDCLVTPEILRNQGCWYLYYITKGSSTEAPLPQWIRCKWKIDPDKKTKNDKEDKEMVSGTLYIRFVTGKEIEATMDAECVNVDGSTYLLLDGHEISPSNERARGYFPRRAIYTKSDKQAIFFVGTFGYRADNTLNPCASYAVLANRILEPHQILQLENSNLVSLLTYGHTKSLPSSCD